MLKILSHRIAIAGVLLLAGMFASSSAWAATPANTQLVNTATLSFDGISTPIQATSIVIVELKTANVVIAAPYSLPANQSKPENSTDFSATYTVISQANGPDTYQISAAAVAANVTGQGSFLVNGGATYDLDLGATALSVISTASTTITVPSDGDGTSGAGVTEDEIVNGIQPNDTVVIGTTEYTVSSVTDPGGSGNATIVLNSAVPASLAIGTPVYESGSFTLTTSTVGTVNGAAPNTLTVTTTIDNFSDTAFTPTALVITVVQINFDKYVRCVSVCGSGVGATSFQYDSSTNTAGSGATYYKSGITAQTGATLEYLLVINNPSAVDLTTAVASDTLDPFTTYDAATTLMNGVAVPDEGGFPLTGDNGGLELDDGTGFSPNEGDGIVAASATVYVVYQVSVN